MEENTGNQQKPLRRTSNKIKDLYNTYMKNDSGRTIPVTDGDNIKQKIEDELEKQNFNSDDASIPPEIIELIENMKSENDSLSEKVTELTKERDEFKDQAARKAAELENFRRRTMKEKQEMVDYANERLLFKLLELLDDIQAAVEAGRKSNDYDALLKGNEMILTKAQRMFEDAGVKRMESYVGKEFDVNLHDALMAAPSAEPEGTILQEIQPGYVIGEKVLRHAKVITSSGNAATN